MVVWLFLAVPWVSLRFVIVVFPNDTQLLFLHLKQVHIKYCTTVYERNSKKLFWSIKNSGEILNKLKSRGLLASGLST